MTNTHLTDVSATHIYLKKYSDDSKIIRVKNWISGRDIDISLVIPHPSDKDKIEQSEAIEIADSVHQNEKICTTGFPGTGTSTIGKTTTCGQITKFVVSNCLHSNRLMPIYENDAIVNTGNSGGPVISKKSGKLVGIAFQYSGKTRVSFIIPNFMVRHFLDDIEDGKYDGMPKFNAKINKTYRHFKFLYPEKISPAEGMKITKISDNSALKNVLYPGDIIIKIGKYSVNYEGKVKHDGINYVDFRWLISQYQIGEKIKLEVWRHAPAPVVTNNPITPVIFVPKWQKIPVEITAERPVEPNLNPPYNIRYIIVGGLKFTEIRSAYGSGVRLSSVYTTDETISYELCRKTVKEINEVKIVNGMITKIEGKATKIKNIESVITAFGAENPRNTINAMEIMPTIGLAPNPEFIKNIPRFFKIYQIILDDEIDIYITGLTEFLSPVINKSGKDRSDDLR